MDQEEIENQQQSDGEQKDSRNIKFPERTRQQINTEQESFPTHKCPAITGMCCDKI